ncbi:MAG: helix-turn-helix transcriptional regulator [Candidatus Aminicenantes bacterium]|jgi:transcriptional regulator with XRE-family HTH domain
MEKKALLDGFRKRLRETRNALGMTQGEFAKYLEVSKPTYVRYEAGEMMPKAGFLNALISKFNVNLNWLLAGEEDMFRRPEIPGEIPPWIPHKSHDDERYREMAELMQISVIEQIIMSKLAELKRIFKEEIERYFSDQKNKQ